MNVGEARARLSKGEQALTTTQLSERTGVNAPTLRMWESRHGFPRPARLRGGHRRYSQADVDRVRDVLGLREQGLSLRAAIARAQAAERAQPSSIFAGLAQRRPDLRPMILGKPAMLALSHAVEDEYCAHAGAGLLIGSFQRVRFYRQSERRWRELARTARVAIALADFKRVRRSPGMPVEVPVARDNPLAREWAILFHGPAASCCLASWEIPSARAGSKRRFEVLWSPEPEVALEAVKLVAELIRPLTPSTGALLSHYAAEPPRSSPELRTAAGQAQRMLSYLADPARAAL